VDEAEALVDALQFDCQFAHDDPLCAFEPTNRCRGLSVPSLTVLLLPVRLSSLLALTAGLLAGLVTRRYSSCRPAIAQRDQP
jgi:hypothetical protein